MAGHAELSKDVDIDIAALFSNVWKMKWLIMVVSVLAGLAIFTIMSSISPRYQTTAQLIIEPRESQFTRVQNQSSGINSNEFDTAAVLSQVQIILSDSIAIAVIKKLNLASKPEFQGEGKPSMLSDLFVFAGVKESPLNIPPEERVLKSFKERLKAYSVSNSRVIEILFWANDPQLAKQIANTIADEYLLLQRNAKLETDSSATKFLAPEIETLRSKVRIAEARVAEFRSNSDILVGTNNSLLATQQMSEVSSQLLRLRAEHSAAQAKVGSIRSTINAGGSLEGIPEVSNSALIQRLRESQIRLQGQISQLGTTLLAAHPRLKALKSQVAGFDKQILREARGILKSLENNVLILRQQEKSLISELGRLKSEAARAGEAEVELRALEREAASESELLQVYMSKFREAAGRQSSKYLPINARIISGAHLPNGSFFPKTIPYTITGTLVTAILTMIGILTVSLLNGKAFKTVYNHEQTTQYQSRQLPPQVDPSTFGNTIDNSRMPGSYIRDEQVPFQREPASAQNSSYQNEPAYQPEISPAQVSPVSSFDLERPHNSSGPQNRREKFSQSARPTGNTQVRNEPVHNAPVRNEPTHNAAPPAPVSRQTRTQPSFATNGATDIAGNFGEFDSDNPKSTINENISISLAADGILGMGHCRIAIVSPGGDEGSLATWFLARKLADSAKSVIVVDMTGSGITSLQMLGSMSMDGVSDLLAGSVKLDDVIYQDQSSSANVLPIGNSAPTDSDVAVKRLNSICDSLLDNYDYLIIDCGIADINGLAQVADADTVVLISAIGYDEAGKLEEEFIRSGYVESICVHHHPKKFNRFPISQPKVSRPIKFNRWS